MSVRKYIQLSTQNVQLCAKAADCPKMLLKLTQDQIQVISGSPCEGEQQ